ncbi:MAG: lysylphosphatidylglycerol synthase transmembrane domain-containing protein [Pirellulales bacterium]
MKRVINVLKIVVPLAIVGWLLNDLIRNHPDELAALRSRPLRWDLLVGGIVCIVVALCLTFYRWYLLVRALDIPFRTQDAFRLGFVGYLLNFVSLGGVGGDLFKAVFLASEQPARRTEAVATIVIDRVVGLFGLLLVAATALANLNTEHHPHLARLAQGTVWIGALLGLGMLAMLFVHKVPGSITRWLISWPGIGPIFHRLLTAMECYARRRSVWLVAIGLSVLAHLTLTAAVFLGSRAAFPQGPTFVEHLVMVPLANVAGALPIAPMGLGQFEAAMTFLFDTVPADDRGQGIGILVALTYRLMTIAVVPIGILYYWLNRQWMRDLIVRAGQESPTRAG